MFWSTPITFWTGIRVQVQKSAVPNWDNMPSIWSFLGSIQNPPCFLGMLSGCLGYNGANHNLQCLLLQLVPTQLLRACANTGLCLYLSLDQPSLSSSHFPLAHSPSAWTHSQWLPPPNSHGKRPFPYGSVARHCLEPQHLPRLVEPCLVLLILSWSLPAGRWEAGRGLARCRLNPGVGHGCGSEAAWRPWPQLHFQHAHQTNPSSKSTGLCCTGGREGGKTRLKELAPRATTATKYGVNKIGQQQQNWG